MSSRAFAAAFSIPLFAAADETVYRKPPKEVLDVLHAPPREAKP